jgi:hypothetical protein
MAENRTRTTGPLAGGLAALLLAATSPAALAGRTELASVNSAGVQGNDYSARPTISGNGAVVAFQSFATNLVEGDTNGTMQIYVRDRRNGRTVLAPVGSTGERADDLCQVALISKEGRRVVFGSFADNLVANDTNGRSDIFVRDLEAGTTVRASVGPGGQEFEGGVAGPEAISADARLVVFWTQKDLGDNRFLDTLMTRDLEAGTTVIESRNAKGELANGQFSDIRMTPDGRYLAFDSESTDLLPGVDSGRLNVYLRDRAAGTFRLVSVTPDGRPSAGEAFTVGLSADGGLVAFGSNADDLVAGGGAGGKVVPYVRDMRAGKTTRLAITPPGVEPNGDTYVYGMSGDGRRVLLLSYASNIQPGDVNGDGDAFVHDRLTGETTLVSARPNGGFARKGGTNGVISISLNGRWVAFESSASTLVPNDANHAIDVFVRKLPAP